MNNNRKPKSAGDPLFYGATQPEGGQGSRPHALFASEPTAGVAIILDRNDPNSIAQEFVRRKYCKQGALTLYFKGGEYWRFNYYEEMEFNVLSAEVYGFISAAKCYHRNNPVSMTVRPSDVDNVLKCIKAGVTIPSSLPHQCWIESEQPGMELFAFKNKVVNVRTGETIDPTPKLWITDAVDFNYDPTAQCPRWEQFLEEIHPNDPEAQNCIEEQLGYGMTYDMHFEKIAVWIGKPRAGKSTLLHIQRGLVGKRAFAPFSFHDWTRSEKSRENIIGKKVAAFSDTRLKPPKVYGRSGYDPGGLDYNSIQTLLKISGRDSESVGQLYKKAWEGDLFCKIIITSNERLNIQDLVLLSRMIYVDFKQSWADSPDRDDYLREKLDAELPGIANRCLAAYRQLLDRGRFIQPASASHLAHQMAAQASPISAFMQEWWIRDQDADGPLASQVHATFKAWCESHERGELLHSYPREQELMKAIIKLPEFSWLKGVRKSGKTVVHYPGIRQRTKADWKNEEMQEAQVIEPAPKVYRRF
jgi:putative DNA primase/helicase